MTIFAIAWYCDTVFIKLLFKFNTDKLSVEVQTDSHVVFTDVVFTEVFFFFFGGGSQFFSKYAIFSSPESLGL